MRVEIDGRQLDLSNLDKPLYEDGFTKGEVIDYYTRIAPVLLPHLADRPLTRIRFPSGTHTAGFFEKNAPAGTPSWIPRTPDGLIVCEELATLVWLANLAALELHTPQWRVGSPDRPDMVVFDLDPGPPAGLDECRTVALAIKDRLALDGREAFAKTSGRKGMQVSAAWTGNADEAQSYVKAIAAEFAKAAPGQITDRMVVAGRTGKVFIDWSQNNPSKTTVTAYSLRAGPIPTVSTPLSWPEVAKGGFTPETFTPAETLHRVTTTGDLYSR
ncbi:bifunctional non-homologous end joining protein LigD [Allocatelliglobosispora scoriae]|uniref:Bifunctional non-homologous end joining protein LigD n=1 Tax=Allocatelliglobosispora scoriae TaxID=643052 RepID=A0A841BSZ6_9ACTN|nr:non-homologous end-joining DNA ligase [Allocatelliglobosispora scoriae]MBB5871344.1 bifunctional non-homologous end joining protein LigD [Allocatelliglobosispora scoriae]